MASSGIYTFAPTRDNLIMDALLYINGIGEGETPSSALTTEALRVLNMIVKLRAADGMPAWAVRTGYVLPFTGRSIATDSHVVNGNHVYTTISADEASGQTVLSITSTTGFVAADQIGIEQDDGTMHWTTIVSVDSTTQVTITAALTAAASSGNSVYVYTASTTRVAKPIRIVSAWLKNSATLVSTKMDIYSQNEYFDISNQDASGTPTVISYTIQPSSDIALNTNGRIRVWPKFSSGDSVIEFLYQRPFQDFSATTDTPDFPQAFYMPLMIELAAHLAPRFNVPMDERKALLQIAQMYREEALSTVYEEGSMYVTPESDA